MMTKVLSMLEKKYRAVWHNEKGELVYGVFTNLETAADEVEFKTALDFIAWLEDEAHNKVEIENT